MKSCSDILKEMRDSINNPWVSKNVESVESVERLALKGNEGAAFEGCVIYADLKGSTDLVNAYRYSFAASIYKAYIRCVCDVIVNNGGSITSFDGDRAMAIFYGSSKCTDAVRTALQIRFVVSELNKIVSSKYPNLQYRVDYGVGVDVSEIFAVKTGIRNYNDIAWVGSAANIAAKLSEIRGRAENAFITKRVFDRMSDASKYGGDPKRIMWTDTGLRISGHSVYGSDWWWKIR